MASVKIDLDFFKRPEWVWAGAQERGIWMSLFISSLTILTEEMCEEANSWPDRVCYVYAGVGRATMLEPFAGGLYGVIEGRGMWLLSALAEE